jgi:hypothetical protein
VGGGRWSVVGTVPRGVATGFRAESKIKNQKSKGKRQKAKGKNEEGRGSAFIFAFCLLPFDF